MTQDTRPTQARPDLAPALPAPAAPAAHPGLARGWRRVVVLLAGTATMALQMCATRLLAPVVGGSSMVFATVIGLSLLAMALGYSLGGRLSDRRPDGRLLGRLLAAAALLIVAIPLISGPVLGISTLGLEGSVSSVLVGSGTAYLLLFAAPAVLLGMVVPFVIRLAVPDVAHLGGTTGNIYALSTVGSVIGTLGSALVLLQAIGTRATLLTVAALVAAAAAVSLARGRREVAPTGPLPEADGTTRATAIGILSVTAAGAVIFVEGVATMATEMSAARLLAPYFGAGTIVWGNIIAVAMVAIAIGSWWGGRLADRARTTRSLARIILVAAIGVVLLPLVGGPVMRSTTDGAGASVTGSFLASLALLALPMILLAAMPPLVIRLSTPDREHTGRTVGMLYATSTIGALVGTFGSVLVGIPVLGTPLVLLLVAAMLMVLAWKVADGSPLQLSLGLAFTLIVLLPLTLAGSTGPRSDDEEVLFEGESRYQFVQVVKDSEQRHLLRLNEGHAVHSVWSPNSVLAGGVWDSFLLLPALTDAEEPASADVLILGNAAGSAMRSYRVAWPDVEVTGVEIDPLVTEVGREHFGLDEGDEQVITADARPFLQRADRSWDAIHIDAYRQPYIPFYLTTREFFGTARQHTKPGGVVSVNVAGPKDSEEIRRSIAASMRAEFPLVVRYRATPENELIIAVNDPSATLDDLLERVPVALQRPLERLEAGRADPEYARSIVDRFTEGARVAEPHPGDVLTDDRAPVEWMIDRGLQERGCFICLGV